MPSSNLLSIILCHLKPYVYQFISSQRPKPYVYRYMPSPNLMSIILCHLQILCISFCAFSKPCVYHSMPSSNLMSIILCHPQTDVYHSMVFFGIIFVRHFFIITSTLNSNRVKLKLKVSFHKCCELVCIWRKDNLTLQGPVILSLLQA